jgi:hypothetical protein
MKKVLIDMLEVNSAAEFIADNNPYNFTALEARESIMDTIKSLAKRNKNASDEDWIMFQGTMGYYVLMSKETEVLATVNVLVEPVIGKDGEYYYYKLKTDKLVPVDD